jgi:hypothetical protein
MGGSRLWRRLLKTQAMREQHAICPECFLPLAFRLGALTRIDPNAAFVLENVRLIHPECQRPSQREGFAYQPPNIQSVAAE